MRRQLELPFVQPAYPAQLPKARGLIQATIKFTKTSPELTKHDRVVFNRLLRQAHGPRLGVANEVFSIPLAALRGNRKDNARVGSSMDRLQQSLVVVELDGKSAWQTSLIGGHDFFAKTRHPNHMTYSFDKSLAMYFATALTFGKLDLDVMEAFDSKYSIPFYENVCANINLRSRPSVTLPLERFRLQFLSVRPGRYKTWSLLRREALDSAVEEINRLAHFTVAVEGMAGKGRTIREVHVSWREKGEDAQREARDEVRFRMARAIN